MVVLAKTVFFELEGWEKEYLSKKLRGRGILLLSERLGSGNISQATDAEIISVFIYSKIGKKELDMLPKLKMIATRSTGFDHIDVKECSRRGIAVCNVPSYGSETVAEHAMALILALSKRIVESVERTRKGDFTLAGLRTFDLEKKTLGIIGLGRIGAHTSKMAHSFGMNVIAYSPKPDTRLAKKAHCKLVGLAELYAKSDIISLHAPLTPQTHHMINAESIVKMKQGVIIINTARGGLVDARALVYALESKKVSAAGLDVLEEECGIKEERQLLSPHFAGECDLKTVLANHVLLNQPNVIITPHNAFNSTEALQRILDTTIMNIRAYAAGRLENQVKSP